MGKKQRPAPSCGVVNLSEAEQRRVKGGCGGATSSLRNRLSSYRNYVRDGYTSTQAYQYSSGGYSV